MNCKEARDMIHESLDHVLGNDDGRELQEHLESCDSCCRFAKLFKALKERMKESGEGIITEGYYGLGEEP